MGIRKYFSTIREAECLERRSIKEWKENGTKEEAVKVFELQKRKKRNNTIIGLVYAGALLVGSQIVKKK